MLPSLPSRRFRWMAGLVLSAVTLVGCGQPVEDERWGGTFAARVDVPGGEVPPSEPAPGPDSAAPVTGPPPTVPPAPVLPETDQASASAPVEPSEGSGGGSCGVQLVEFTMGAGAPTGLAAGGDGSVWFTDSVAGLIGHLGADGSVARYRLPSGSTPGAIAPGPDGNYWFVDPRVDWRDTTVPGGRSTGAPAVGRITPSGQVDVFPLPTAEQNRMGGPGVGSLPYDIVTGPDDAMWVTESGADKIARVSLDGTITEFDVPSRSVMHAHLGGIVSGPDGALWFQQALRNSLGRYDPTTNRFDEFPKLDDEHGLIGGQGLEVSVDGALWFEGFGNGSGTAGLNRMTIDGRMRHFPLPGDRWRNGAAALAPDRAGGVWFLDGTGGPPAHMSPEGAITRFAALDARPATQELAIGSGGMTTAADGTVWYSRPDRHTIGRIACG